MHFNVVSHHMKSKILYFTGPFDICHFDICFLHNNVFI